LRRREVGPHPGSEIAGLTDVEDFAAGVLEEVDARRRRQPFGEVTLGDLLRGDPGGEDRQLLEGVNAVGTQPFDQPVEDIDGRPGISQGTGTRHRGGSANTGYKK